MDLQTFESILNCFFDRAVISLSFNAANRLAKHSSLVGINCIICFILLRQIPRPQTPPHLPMMSRAEFGPLLRRNDCIRTTFSILVSKLFVSLCIPPLHDNVLLPSMCIYLVVAAGICQVLSLALCGCGS